MGGCLSLDEEEKKARQKSEAIDRMLEQEGREEENVVKILLLGAGESGKSTLVKQMKIIHNDGFSEDELDSFTPTILDNLVQSMKYVLTGMGLLRINLENPKNKYHAQTLLACQRCTENNDDDDDDDDDDDENVDVKGFSSRGKNNINNNNNNNNNNNSRRRRRRMQPSVASALRSLWKDKGVRLCVSRGYEYELNDSAVYYFENMERLCSEKYAPTPGDVLRARVRTSGIIETRFRINRVCFRMFDVGGQRSERRKWIQCFDNVKALLFVSALSGYDMTLYEDASKNRLEESLLMFQQIVNNPYFRQSALILFLNKTDLFQDKIRFSGRHLRYYFPDYQGTDGDVETAARYIQNLFLAKTRERQLQQQRQQQPRRKSTSSSSSSLNHHQQQQQQQQQPQPQNAMIQQRRNNNNNVDFPSKHQQQHQQQQQPPQRVIYPHFTCATDTSNVQVVFQSVMDTIVRENLSKVSLL